jgi:ArsR family transcriptional regulator
VVHSGTGLLAGRPAESASSAPQSAPLLWLANIPEIEYSNVVQSLLRSYKASLFQALSHPTRIAIVEVLREGEHSAGSIQEHLGIEQANLSQHLAILRSRQIVVNRKEGNQVFYSLRSPVLLEVFDIMRRYFQANLTEAVQMLGEIEAEPTQR